MMPDNGISAPVKKCLYLLWKVIPIGNHLVPLVFFDRNHCLFRLVHRVLFYSEFIGRIRSFVSSPRALFTAVDTG